MNIADNAFINDICMLVDFILKYFFVFIINQYLQINGTSMGTKLASMYANIFMHYVKVHSFLYLIYNKQHFYDI